VVAQTVTSRDGSTLNIPGGMDLGAFPGFQSSAAKTEEAATKGRMKRGKWVIGRQQSGLKPE
jgi:hypothetical protein